MNMTERNDKLRDFFKDGCMSILEKKGKDYNPSGTAFTDIEENAKDLGVTPEQVLMVFMSKHWAAMQSHAKTGRLASEPIAERCKDLANYCAMYAVYQESKKAGCEDSQCCGGESQEDAKVYEPLSGQLVKVYAIDLFPISFIAQVVNECGPSVVVQWTGDKNRVKEAKLLKGQCRMLNGMELI